MRLSAQAHEHIALDNPEDYEFCLKYMAQTISDSTYVGKAPWHIRNFEMVKLIEGHNLLVAIGLEQNKFGNYSIKSAYRLTYEQVRQRLRGKHFLWPTRKKPPV